MYHLINTLFKKKTIQPPTSVDCPLCYKSKKIEKMSDIQTCAEFF